MWYTTLTTTTTKAHDHLNRHSKSIRTKFNIHSDQNSHQSGSRGSISQHNAIYFKPTANIILNGEKWKAFLLNSGTRQGCPLFTTFIQHSIGNPSHSSQTRKINEMYSNWKKRGKTVTICRWHDNLYTDPKIPTQKFLELINEFS